MKRLQSITTHHYILLGILVLGAVLRFWNFSEIPFTHDEFSALGRLHFDSFGELIAKGVKIDGHPAGVHVFMYYWIQLFGESEIAVKFPFITMGIASIYLIYSIGKLWFNYSVGLISAAFMATMEFSVMYSQIARPYISGLFLCLLMVVYWSKLIKTPQTNFWKNYTGFVLAAALCAYNHHFSLLFAAIVGVSGVFLVQKKYLLKYALSGLAIFVLYLPHLSIFLYQLNIGGVESWLAKPKPDFLWEFIKYLFHFSTIIYALVILIIVGGLCLNKKKKFSKYFFLSVVWFVLPFLIGYYYSIYNNAVLQYSVLIFSFPFLLLAIFSFVPKLSNNYLIPIIVLISIGNSYSLVFQRDYYPLFYQNRYKQFLVDTQQKVNELGKENCAVLLVNHPRINQYYFEKLGLTFDYFNYLKEGEDVNYQNLFEIVDYVNNSETQYFIYGSVAYAPENIHSIIKARYPTLLQQRHYYASKMEVFENNISTTKEYTYINVLDFDKPDEKWNFDKSKLGKTSLGSTQYVFEIDSLSEYSVNFKIDLNDLALSQNDIIDLSVDVFSQKDFEEVLLVASISQGDSTLKWMGVKPSQFDIEKSKWESLHLSIDIRDIDLSQPTILKTYLWNKDKMNFYINSFAVKIRKGNPILYGLTEKIVMRIYRDGEMIR